MLRERFYEIIDSARSDRTPKGDSADPEALAAALRQLSDSDLADFVIAFDDELISLNRWDIWAVGYVADGGMSDDGFHYFRGWLIGKGRTVVDAVLAEPDSLADVIGQTDLENESLQYAALDLLEERGLPDPRDGDPARQHADDEPTGTAFDEEDVEDHYPRTATAAAE